MSEIWIDGADGAQTLRIDQLEAGASFPVEIVLEDGRTLSYNYTVLEPSYSIGIVGIPGGELEELWDSDLFGLRVMDPVRADVAGIRVRLPLPFAEETLLQDGLLRSGDATVEITVIKAGEADDGQALLPESEEVRVRLVMEDAYLAISGTFTAADEGEDAAAALSYAYDPDSEMLTLSGSFLLQEEGGGGGGAEENGMLLLYPVEAAGWDELWSRWTEGGGGPDPSLVLSVSGESLRSSDTSEAGRVTVISGESPLVLELVSGDGSGGDTPVISFGQRESEPAIEVVVEDKGTFTVEAAGGALTLRCASPAEFVTEDKTWTLGRGAMVLVSGYDEASWSGAVNSGALDGAFIVRGGSADESEDGTLTIAGTEEAPVYLERASQTDAVLIPWLTRDAEQASGFPLVSAILGGALLLACGAAAVLGARLHQAKKAPSMPVPVPAPAPPPVVEEPNPTVEPAPQNPRMPTLRVGKMQNVGNRRGQQDSMGLAALEGGVFAVVADGMGGLTDGDRVSQKIVQTMLADVSGRRVEQIEESLVQLVSHANTEVNQMLGYGGQYKSGSTLLAVAVAPGRFRWVAVGDSRIYLYRGGSLLKINHEHVYEVELLTRAANRELSFQEARSSAKKGSVTSFIGMGELKYIDMALEPVLLRPGDTVLLMSDGVFNTLSEPEIARVLAANPDPAQAAAALESAVLARRNPHQDNFTAVLVDFR